MKSLFFFSHIHREVRFTEAFLFLHGVSYVGMALQERRLRFGLGAPQSCSSRGFWRQTLYPQFYLGSSFKCALHREVRSGHLLLLFIVEISPWAWCYNIMLSKIFLLRNADWIYPPSYKEWKRGEGDFSISNQEAAARIISITDLRRFGHILHYCDDRSSLIRNRLLKSVQNTLLNSLTIWQ